MKVGDLVWHVHDINDGIAVPGLVVGFDSHNFVLVRFVDKDVPERHIEAELTYDPRYEEDENIMGNP